MAAYFFWKNMLKSPEVKYSNPEHNNYLSRQIEAHAKIMHQRGFYPEPLSEETKHRIGCLVTMQNEKAGHRKTARARSIAYGWETLKQSDKIQGKDDGCMDGRDNEGVNVDEVTESWRLPGGQVTVRDRKSGKILEAHEIPDYNPEDLTVVSPIIIARQKLRALQRQEIFVTAFAHAECMMWDYGITPHLASEHRKEHKPPVEAHADFLESYTLALLKQTHNYFRDEPLDEIGLVAMLMPSNYDTIYRNNGDRISAQEQAREFKRDIRRMFMRNYGYGEFTEDFAGEEPLSLDRNLALSERELMVVHRLLEFPKFSTMVEDFLSKGKRRFTPLQAHYFKVRFGKLMAFHDAVNFEQIPEHYLRRHREEATGISERGNPPLQRHPMQTLAISPANTDKAIKFGEIALDVMSRANNSGLPHIFLIASEIPDVRAWAGGYYYDLRDPGVLRADANNANLFLSLAYSPRFRKEVTLGRAVLVPVAMEQDGYTITDIPDHSLGVPDNGKY